MIQQLETNFYDSIYPGSTLRDWMKCPYEQQKLTVSTLCVLVHICDGNYCAAMLLCIFYEREKFTRQVYSGLGDYRDPNEWDEELMESLFLWTSHLFARDDILNALSLLKAKQYIDIRFGPVAAYEEWSNDGLAWRVYLSHVNEAINTLLGENIFLEREQPPLREMFSPAQLPVIEELLPAVAITPVDTQEERNLRKETKKVAYHMGRARTLGLPATLTQGQWIKTLDYFNWRCAYCAGAYEVFEHFTPLFHGGGTEQGNCVPACNGCNSKKRDSHPVTIDGQMQESIERVLKYLQSTH